MRKVKTYDEFLNESPRFDFTGLDDHIRMSCGPKTMLSVKKLDDFVPFDFLFKPNYEDAKMIGSVYFNKKKPNKREIEDYIIRNVTKSPELFELIPDKYLTDKIKKTFPDLTMAKEFGMFDD